MPTDTLGDSAQFPKTGNRDSIVDPWISLFESSLLPDLLVIGAFKAGTTSLHHYLGQHARIFMTRVKEPNFFAYDENSVANPTDFPITNIDDYERLFDEAKPGQLLGEASPGYLHSPIAPLRIHSCIPNGKLIASLRNPVDRAYSHYLMYYRIGRTQLSAQAAFNAGGFWVDASLYADALATYRRLFGDQLKEWLGLSQMTDLDTTERHNPGGLPRSRLIHRSFELVRNLPIVQEFVPSRTRARLARIRNANLKAAPTLPEPEAARWREYFREDIHRTQDILKMDLARWLE
jgi:hypothetical protein